MAAQDNFKISITTTADTSGAVKAAQSLDQVKGSAVATGTEGAPGIDLLTARTVALSAAAGAAVTAIAAFQSEMRASIAVADRLEDAVGRFQGQVSGEALQQLGNVASLNGSSVEGVTQSLNFLIKNSQTAIEGNVELQKSFETLGLSVDDLKKLTPDEMFLRISDAVKDAADPAAAYAAVLDTMGRNAGTMIATLALGSKQIKETGKDMGFWADDTRLRLAAAQDDLDKLSNQFTIFAGETTANVLTSFRALANAPAPTIAKLLTLFDVFGLSGPAVLKIAEMTNQMDGLKDAAGPIAESVRKIGVAAEDLPDRELALKKELKDSAEAADAAKAAIDRLTSTSDKLKSLQEQIFSAQDAATKAEIDRKVESGAITGEEAARQKLAVDINARDRADAAALGDLDSQIADAQNRKLAADAKVEAAGKRFGGTLKLDDEGRAAIKELEAVSAEIENLKKIRAGTSKRQMIERGSALDNGQFRVEQAAQRDRDKPQLGPQLPPDWQAILDIRNQAAPFLNESNTSSGVGARRIDAAYKKLQDSGEQPGEREEFYAAAERFAEEARLSAEQRRETDRKLLIVFRSLGQNSDGK